VLYGRVPLTHEISAAAWLAGIEALLVPSTRHNTSTNIVVIYDQILTTSASRFTTHRDFAASTTTEVVGRRPADSHMADDKNGSMMFAITSAPERRVVLRLWLPCTVHDFRLTAT